MEAVVPLVMEIIDMSESSDDESVREIIQFMGKKQNIPKIVNYLGVVSEYSDEQFKSHFRVSRETAKHITNAFQKSQFCPRGNHGGSKVVSAENQLLSFLWFAGNKCSIRDVADRFGIGQVTFYRQCERIISFLVHLAPEVIIFPRTAEEKHLIAEEFEKVSGFPDVLGCVDGTSITIRTPANKIKLTYVNRHDIPSVTLQGICDAKRRFVDVFTGAPGKIHDSRVFDLSPISKEIPTICEKKYHLLGDSAYSIREYLLTPYRDYGNLTNEKILFNKKFCSTRVLIENTFGLLKGRFRQLSCLEFHSVDKITKFIMACCVLHNLCINRVDFIEEHDNIHNIVDGVVANETLADVTLRQVGEIKRDFFCNQFNNIGV